MSCTGLTATLLKRKPSWVEVVKEGPSSGLSLVPYSSYQKHTRWLFEGFRERGKKKNHISVTAIKVL